MVVERSQLEQAWHAARELAARRRADPVAYMRWLPLQHEFLWSDERVKQIRAGNQTIGKTTPALAEVIGRCRGVHPLGRPGVYRQPPIEAWVICASWSQSLGIQAKLAALLPWGEVTERTSYDPISGFASRPRARTRSTSRAPRSPACCSTNRRSSRGCTPRR
jgi:hypothetical protein